MNLGQIFSENLTAGHSFGRRQSRRFTEALYQEKSGHSVWASGMPAFLKLVVFALTATLFTQLILLQVIEGPSYRSSALINSLQKVPVAAERGLILSAEGEVLSGNAPSFDLYFYGNLCFPQKCGTDFLNSFSFYTPELARTLGKTAETVVVRDLPQEQALALTPFLKDRSYWELKTGQKRNYPLGSSLFHLLGYVSQAAETDLARDPSLSLSGKIGRLGVEETYDSFLRGLPGGQIFEVDAQNHRRRRLREVPAQAGNNLVLSVRADLQAVAGKVLAEAISHSAARGGAVVVQEVKTGAILSLTSLPALDPNIFSSRLSQTKFDEYRNNPTQPFFDRAVLGTFPPGSIFKLVVASGALSEKILNEKTLIDGPGSISLGALTFRDWKREGHGQLNLVGALAESCDTCFYQIGGGYQNFKGLGPEKMAFWARLFGLGDLLGIDLPAEAKGLVPDPQWKKKVKGERWFTGNSYNLAIGQGDLLTTPLQINSLTAAIANGGTLYRPQAAAKIVDSGGHLVRDFPAQALRRSFVDPAVLAIVREGMKKAAQPGGTAYPFFNFNPAIGGKTGTAETSGTKTHAWFTAFAPFDNPEVAVTVFLEEGGEGSRDAAPVAKKILEVYFAER